MTKKEFDALVGADIKRLMKQAENKIMAEKLQALIDRSKQYMGERDWDKEDLFDDKEEREPTNDDDYQEDLKDRYDQMKGL